MFCMRCEHGTCRAVTTLHVVNDCSRQHRGFSEVSDNIESSAARATQHIQCVCVKVCLIEKDVQMSWSKKNYLKRNTIWYFCHGFRKHWRAIISPYGPIRQKKLPAKRRTRAYLLWPMFIRTMPFSLVFTCHLRCSVKECCCFSATIIEKLGKDFFSPVALTRLFQSIPSWNGSG